jgi:uncharacterized protein (DUF2252 family)
VAPNLVRLAFARLTAVRDLDLASFGARHAFGRLIWSVDDFDEACSLGYTNDLVRLTLNAALDVTENRLSMFADLIHGVRATEVQLFSIRFDAS